MVDTDFSPTRIVANWFIPVVGKCWAAILSVIAHHLVRRSTANKCLQVTALRRR
jgi:hypothetical protein